MAGTPHHPTDRVANTVENIEVLDRQLIDDVGNIVLSRESWDHSIARQEKLARFRPVMQINLLSGIN